jgi:hypothetical protein
MNRKIIIIALSIIIFLIAYDNFYTYGMISGKYLYDFPPAVVEGPNQGDVLTLNDNGSFESNAWGKGTYKLSGSKLILNYGVAYNQFTFYRPLFLGKPRISVVRDLNYYFKKID